MANDPRVYSDEEFALILRKATEMASSADSPVASSDGLTLAEMKSAAAQVGLDPALVERAARMLTTRASATPIERLIGGPLRHEHEARVPVTLDAKRAALLLSAVRISAGIAGGTDVGHSGSMGMTWHDGGELEALKVTARPEDDGTAASVVVDRRGTFAVVAVSSGIAMLMTTLFAGSALYPENPALGYGGFIAGIGGVLAVARGYWASSSRRVQERMAAVMDIVGRTLSKVETQAAPLRKIGNDTTAREPDASGVVNEELTEA